jgi:hypothetical protein
MNDESLSEKKILWPRKIYNSEWGIGEWTNETDYLEFSHKGVRCQIMRNSLGILCGYIHLDSDHPWYGKEYGSIDADVHGGLTFSEMRRDSVYVFGFDCAHSGDVTPACQVALEASRKELSERMPHLKKILEEHELIPCSYKNIDYVTQECMRLADQALAVLDAAKPFSEDSKSD